MAKKNKKQNWRRSREYRIWRVKVIRRDKRCVICGSIKDRNAHHLNHATYFPEERFDVDNGVCLCRECHTQFHTNFKRSFREKCTKYDFENFKCLVSYFKDKFSN
jgi:predicted restriction endonuclease